MIKSIQIQNTGPFEDANMDQLELEQFSLIYGENGRGKTVLAAILRSLSTDNPELINKRHRLGNRNPPKIVIKHPEKTRVFENGAWEEPFPQIAIFDDTFVAENVCSGLEVHPHHRKNLHELILGTEGVKLNNEIKALHKLNEEHNSALSNLEKKIPANIRGPYEVDAFCKRKKDQNIDSKIEKAQKSLAAAQSADEISRKSLFREFIPLPDFDTDKISEVLNKKLEDIASAALEQVQSHFLKIGDGGETWASDGMSRIIKSDHEGSSAEVCPFCAQDLGDSNLIQHYRVYFSKQYENLKKDIRDAINKVHESHTSDIQSTFRQGVHGAQQTHESWKSLADLSEVSIDTEEVVQLWNAALKAVLEQLKAKAAAPLEPMPLKEKTEQVIQKYRDCIKKAASLSEHLKGSNKQLIELKEKVANDDPEALKNTLAELEAQKARFESPVMESCDAYSARKKQKDHDEARRRQALSDLTKHRSAGFPNFEKKINEYLGRFAVSFRLSKVQSQGARGGPSASYYITINKKDVDIKACEGPSFQNTLSAGDRSALALAFFFASLDQDPELQNKTVVIDDPMTSLDGHRTQRTLETIMEMAKKAGQVVVLSHLEEFLCKLWKKAHDRKTATLCINQAKIGSRITTWNMNKKCLPPYNKRYALVNDYMREPDPDKQSEVAEALRHILEGFLQVTYPEHWLLYKSLGKFIEACDKGKITTKEEVDELRNLNEYARQFHHPDGQVNEQELHDFAKRTIRFVSGQGAPHP